MAISRKRALEVCRDLWAWLTKTGKKKEHWPGWEWNGGKYEGMSCECPCCEYTNPFSGGCVLCPLRGRWGTKATKDPYYAECCGYDTIFTRWKEAETPRTRKKYAALIAKAARVELKKYPK
jgi:hypothetical protein